MTQNNNRYELFDNKGNPLPENFLNSVDQKKFDEVFNKVLSYGWVGEGIKLYVLHEGRRKAFHTEPFTEHDGMSRSLDTGDLLDPLFSVWSKA